jgi:hypothetical protein
MALQIRRGPTADRTAKTFLEGELVYDTDLKSLYVGDGETSGGVSASTYTDIQSVNAIGAALDNGTHANISFTYTDDTINATVALDGGLLNVADDTSPQLGANLDLNAHDITGTGNIDITGDVTVTDGMFYGNLEGEASSVTDGIYTSHNFYIGTEQISITRSSLAQTLQGVSIDGNAGTATTLETGRNINGVEFNGSSDITVITEGTGITIDGTEISIGQSVGTTDDVTFNTVIVNGDLTVNGTTTTLNTSILDVEDKNITVAKGALNAAVANGAGLTVDGAGATLLYASTGDKFVFNKAVDATGFNGPLTGTIQTAAQTNITSVGTLTGLTSSGIVTVNYIGSANSSVVIGGSNTKGGAGFHDFLKVTNGASGATNTNKYFRLNNLGTLEVVDSAYANTILSLSDGGLLTANSLTVNGASAINTTTANPLIITIDDTANNTSKSPNLVLTTRVNSNTTGSGPAVKFNVQLSGFAQPLVQVGRLEAISDGDAGASIKFTVNNGTAPGQPAEVTAFSIGNGTVVAEVPFAVNSGVFYMNPSATYATPSSSKGDPGDIPGVVKMDNEYLYYCVGEYDNITNIWSRIPWPAPTTW